MHTTGYPQTIKRFLLNLFLVLVFSLAFQCLSAQAGIESAVRTEARKMSQALLEGDYNRFIRYNHPKIIQAAGGKQRLIAALEQQMKTMADDGFIMERVEIDAPISTERYQGKYQALVPKTTTMTMNGREIVSKDYLFGFSDGEGQEWTFVEAKKLGSPAGKKLFPDFGTTLPLPGLDEPITPESSGETEEESTVTIIDEPEDESMYRLRDEDAFTAGYLIGFILAIILFVGVIVGTIFLILRLVRTTKKEVPETRKPKPTIKQVETIHCSNCGGKNRSNAKYCSFCGYALNS